MTRLPNPQDCNPECHRVEREWVRVETEVLIRLILDGEDDAIAMLVNAMHHLGEAA